MIQFLLAIPAIVLYGCGILLIIAIAITIALYWQTMRVGSQVRMLTRALETFAQNTSSEHRNGLPLATLDEIRSQCEKLSVVPRGWWNAIDSHIERYVSPEDVEGWLLTDKPRDVLPYEVVVGKRFNSAFFSAFPGLLTGAGLTLTFVAILVALQGEHRRSRQRYRHSYQWTFWQVSQLYRRACPKHPVYTV
jgi:hypothetical protein